MFIQHPFEATLINISKFEEIKCCTVNLTHVDFYKTVLPKGKERGEPELIIEFDTQALRDEWFGQLCNLLDAEI